MAHHVNVPCLLLLDGMMIPCGRNRPNQSRRIFRADWMFYVRENWRNELVEGDHRHPLSLEILPWWELWRCHPKRVPIREQRHCSWYYLCRNSNLYEIFLFCKAHCTVHPNTTIPQTSPPWWCRLPFLWCGIFGYARSDKRNTFGRGRARKLWLSLVYKTIKQPPN